MLFISRFTAKDESNVIFIYLFIYSNIIIFNYDEEYFSELSISKTVNVFLQWLWKAVASSGKKLVFKCEFITWICITNYWVSSPIMEVKCVWRNILFWTRICSKLQTLDLHNCHLFASGGAWHIFKKPATDTI